MIWWSGSMVSWGTGPGWFCAVVLRSTFSCIVVSCQFVWPLRTPDEVSLEYRRSPFLLLPPLPNTSTNWFVPSLFWTRVA